MSDNYAAYMPNIDVNDGKARVMGNLKLYMKLLGKFNGRAMVGELIDAINNGNSAGAAQAAHALRGTAANLSFPVLHSATEEIERLSKKGEDCGHLIGSLNAAVAALEDDIAKLIGEIGI